MKEREIYRNICQMMPRNSNFDHNKNTVKHDFVNSYHKDVNGQKIVFDIKRDESKCTNVLFRLIAAMRKGKIKKVNSVSDYYTN